MTRTASPATRPVSDQDYSSIVRFYAAHGQLLDAGRAEEWAEQFTEDGVFAQNVKPEPKVGRPAIAAAMRKGIDALQERGLTRRHWFGMVDAETLEEDAGDADEAVRTRYYAVVFETPAGGEPRIYLSTTAEDVLERRDGQWLVRSRRIDHDGAPA
ncbi:nuclear transport factor 2 family protein [Streptomyces xanthophaeus]|uniref:nuclear transport factor 2 family protein n=1 Tax=Streptomyces xanthophaeus TaxID=67385 RepID=UPI0026480DDE|nr:nuclear transport factor 2 family protein [Streptomyces xanthophaeus]WKD32292.1 nuclear transport factor 2 family protein [Streptomyces xanthophaeus]